MKQTIFELNKNNYEKSDFIVSEANKIAHQIIVNWPNDVWGVHPYERTLILRGPPSSGKSFLAYNWSLPAAAKFININEKLTGEELEAYENFIIEDIDYIQDEKTILHNFNILNERRKYLLMTCVNMPDIKLPDLCSRLKATNSIAISYPDDHLIKILIFKFFSDHFVRIPTPVINYLLQYLPRRFDLLNKILSRINNYSLENKQKITIPLIKKIIVENNNCLV
jgi:chromosomal replication initiation ATPase DnaA